MCYINRIIQYVVSYVWMLTLNGFWSSFTKYMSQFIPSYCWIVFHDMDLPHFVYTLTWWTLRLFLVFGYKTMLLQIFTHKSLYAHMFLLLLGKYSSCGLLDHMVVLSLTFLEAAKLFSKWLNHFIFPQQYIRSHIFHIFTNICYCLSYLL